MQVILTIVVLYFFIGGIAIIRINNKHPEKKKENILKYFTYLFLVSGMIASIQHKLLPYASLIIIYIGLYEIIKAGNTRTGFSSKYITASILAYLPVAISFFLFSSKVKMQEQLFVYIIVFVFDGFSQITGQLTGKTKLAPVISPGKTVEGTAGGVITALITGFAIRQTVSFTFPALIIVTITICLTSLGGDLLASFYKRKSGIKDYSNILPGHGGILDRYDSFIMTGSCYYIMSLFLKP